MSLTKEAKQTPHSIEVSELTHFLFLNKFSATFESLLKGKKYILLHEKKIATEDSKNVLQLKTTDHVLLLQLLNADFLQNILFNFFKIVYILDYKLSIIF